LVISLNSCGALTQIEGADNIIKAMIEVILDQGLLGLRGCLFDGVKLLGRVRIYFRQRRRFGQTYGAVARVLTSTSWRFAEIDHGRRAHLYRFRRPACPASRRSRDRVGPGDSSRSGALYT
jgi:hypothetical protein